jgi:hypothetical protein
LVSFLKKKKILVTYQQEMGLSPLHPPLKKEENHHLPLKREVGRDF